MNKTRIKFSDRTPGEKAYIVTETIITAIGVIILMIGAFMEFEFRDSIKGSNLTKEGIKIARKYSDYANSIALITIGAVIVGICLISEIGFMVYTNSKRKNNQ